MNPHTDLVNIFSLEGAEALTARIHNLNPDQQPLWGKMRADQMLAHCNVMFRFVYEPERFKKPGRILRWFLRTFVKKIVTGPAPYKKNTRTAPEFMITDRRLFENEKAMLIENIKNTCMLGERFFNGRENFSFGKMSVREWNTLFVKHLDHHLRQFGQ